MYDRGRRFEVSFRRESPRVGKRQQQLMPDFSQGDQPVKRPRYFFYVLIVTLAICPPEARAEVLATCLEMVRPSVRSNQDYVELITFF